MRQLQDEEDPVRDAMRARAEEAADDLRGTSKNLRDVATEDERNNTDFCTRLDELVLECVTCNWWCDEDEMCEDTMCGDCCETDHDEEDEDGES